MRALVTGANGFIGAQLCKELAAAGHGVRALVRPSSNLQLLEGLKLEQALGDVTDLEAVQRAVAGVDVVFHLAGIRRTPHAEEFSRINVEGTRHVLEAASRQARPPRVVVAGSLAATGPSSDRPLTEDAPFRPVEPYGQSKVDAEKLCHAFSDRVPFAVGRPPRVLGPGDRENLPFVKIVKRGIVLDLVGPPRPLSFVDVEDVARGFVALGTHPAAERQTFFITSPETLTLAGLQEIPGSTLGKKIRARIPLGAAVVRGAAAVADRVSRLTGKHLPLNHKLAQQLLAPGWWCSSEKAAAQLGFRARVGLHESVARSVRWYQDHGWLS